MKRYILGLTMASALTLGMTSCSDFLEEPIRGQQDMENYFTTEDECAKQITGCYQAIAYDDWWQIYKFWGCVDMCTDDEWMGNTTQDAGDYRHLAHYTGNAVGGGECSQNFWQYRYKGILQCNIALEKIPQVTFNDASLQKRYLAEAKFLRAFFYFDLVKNFGVEHAPFGLIDIQTILGSLRRHVLAHVLKVVVGAEGPVAVASHGFLQIL